MYYFFRESPDNSYFDSSNMNLKNIQIKNKNLTLKSKFISIHMDNLIIKFLKFKYCLMIRTAKFKPLKLILSHLIDVW